VGLLAIAPQTSPLCKARRALGLDRRKARFFERLEVAAMESSNQTPGGPAYPVQFSVEYPDRELNRLATAFRLIVAIPILILASSIGNEGTSAAGEQGWRIVGGTSGLLFLPPLLMILFRQKYPRWWFDWNLELVRFSNRIGVYLALMDDPRLSLPGCQAGPKPLAATRQVAARDPSLRPARLPLARSRRLGGHRMVRDPLHRPLPTRPLRLRARRVPLDKPSRRVRLHPGHRPIPAIPPQPLDLEGRTPLPQQRC
jgi:hypothetical protein